MKKRNSTILYWHNREKRDQWLWKFMFYDIFLDIVLLPDGEIFLLDEDEFKKALDDKIITKVQYDRAYSEANRVIKYISKDPTCLKEMCNKYFEKVLKK